MPANDGDSKKNDANPDSRMGPPEVGPPPPPPPRMGPPPPPPPNLAGSPPAIGARDKKNTAQNIKAEAQTSIEILTATPEALSNWVANNITSARLTVMKPAETKPGQDEEKIAEKRAHLKSLANNFFTFSQIEKESKTINLLLKTFVAGVDKAIKQAKPDQVGDLIKLMEDCNIQRVLHKTSATLEQYGTDLPEKYILYKNTESELAKITSEIQDEKTKEDARRENASDNKVENALREKYTHDQAERGKKKDTLKSTLDSLKSTARQDIAIGTYIELSQKIEPLLKEVELLSSKISSLSPEDKQNPENIEPLKTKAKNLQEIIVKFSNENNIKGKTTILKDNLKNLTGTLGSGEKDSTSSLSEEAKALSVELAPIQAELIKINDEIEIFSMLIKGQGKKLANYEAVITDREALHARKSELESRKYEIENSLEQLAAADKETKQESLSEAAPENDPAQSEIMQLEFQISIYQLLSHKIDSAQEQAAALSLKLEQGKKTPQSEAAKPKGRDLSGLKKSGPDIMPKYEIDLSSFTKSELNNLGIFLAPDKAQLQIILNEIEDNKHAALNKLVKDLLSNDNTTNFQTILDIGIGNIYRKPGKFAPSEFLKVMKENVFKRDEPVPVNSAYRLVRLESNNNPLANKPKKEWSMDIGYLEPAEKNNLAQFFYGAHYDQIDLARLQAKVNATLQSPGTNWIDIIDIYRGKINRSPDSAGEITLFDDSFIDNRPTGKLEDKKMQRDLEKAIKSETQRYKTYLADKARIEKEKAERIEQAKEAAIAILMSSESNDGNAPFDTDKFKQAFTSALQEAGPLNANENQDSTPPLDDIELTPELLEAAKAVAAARIEKAKEESRTQAEKEAEEQVRTLQIQEAVQEAKSQAYKILGDTPNPEAFSIICRSKLSDIATDKNLGDISQHPAAIAGLSELDLASPAASEISINESEETPLLKQDSASDLRDEAGKSDPANQSDPDDYSDGLEALFGNQKQDIENIVALDSEPEALELGDSDQSVESNIRPPSKIEALLNSRGKASSDQNITIQCHNLEAETKAHAEQIRKQKIANNPSEQQHQTFLQYAALILATDEKLTAGEKGHLYLALLQNIDFQLTPVTVSPVKKFISEEVGHLRKMGITLTGMRAANAQTSAVAYLRQTGLSKDFAEISSDISKTASSLQRIERSKESNVLWRHFARQVNMLGQSSNGYLPQNHPADWARFMAAVRDLHSLAPNPPQQYPALTQAVWNAYSNLKQDLPGEYYLDPEKNKMVSEGFEWISFDREFSPLFPATQQVTIQQDKKGAEETVLSLPERDKDAEKTRDTAITQNLSRRKTGSQIGDVLDGYKSKEDEIAATRNVFQRIGRQISGTELSSTRESQIHLIQDIINSLNENTSLSTYEKGQLYYTMLKMMQGELSSESASRLKTFVDDEIGLFNAQVNPSQSGIFHQEMLKPSQLMSYLRQNDFHHRYDNEDGKAAYNQLELFLKTHSNFLSEVQVRKQIWHALDAAKLELSTAISKYLPTNHPADWARFEAAFQALKDKAPDSPNQHPELLKQCWEALQKLQQDMPEITGEAGFKWKPILKQLQPLLPMQARLALGLFAKTPLSEEEEVKATERSQKALQFSKSPSNMTKLVINDFLEQHRKSGPASIEKVLKQHAPEAEMTTELRLAQSMLDNIHYDASLSADQKIQITYGLLRSINSELKSQPKNVESQDAFLGLLEDFYRRVENNPNVQPSLLNDTRQCQENFIRYIAEHGDKLKAIGKALPKDVINVMGNVTRTLNTAPPRSRKDEHNQVNAVIALHQSGPRADQLYQLAANAKVDPNTRQNANLLRNTVDYLNQQPNLSPETKGHILIGVVEQLMEQHAKDKKSELLPILNQLNASLKDLYLSELKGAKESTFKSFVKTAPLSGPAWDRMKGNMETADHKRKGKAGR